MLSRRGTRRAVEPVSFIADVIARGGVAGVAGLTLIETFFPPIPSEVVMPLAGVAAAKGHMPLWGAILGGVAGSMGGNWAFYWGARRLGTERFEAWIDRHGRWLTLDRETVEKARHWFERAGPWVVGAGRCVPGIRSVVSIPAGLAGMAPLPFLAWSALGTTVWVTALTTAGYRLGKSGLPVIEQLLGPVSWVIVGGAVLLYVYRLATWRTR